MTTILPVTLSSSESNPDLARYTVIYDGNCNLCANWVRLLVQIDRADQFTYLPMQHPQLDRWGVSPADCQQGMILLDPTRRQRWQGSQAAEEIARLLPGGAVLIAAYRALPGLKGLGDRAYLQIRDNRYDWFGQRSTYWVEPLEASLESPIGPSPLDPASDECHTGNCSL
jgi:predicted DCC family thiol-disulfide oxidoreductase YuxK